MFDHIDFTVDEHRQPLSLLACCLRTASQLQELQRSDPRTGPESVPGQRRDLGHRQEHHRDH